MANSAFAATVIVRSSEARSAMEVRECSWEKARVTVYESWSVAADAVRTVSPWGRAVSRAVWTESASVAEEVLS